MNKHQIIARQKAFVIAVVQFVELLPKGLAYSIFARQLIRAGSSVGANYRAACRGKSAADFINKLKIVEEEADESIYWLELLAELKNIDQVAVKNLIKEMNEILAITVASIKTVKNNRK